MYYSNNSEVRIGDDVLYSGTPAIVEEVIEVDQIDTWKLDEPGFMIVCEQYGRILINPGNADWEDIEFVRRGERDASSAMNQ